MARKGIDKEAVAALRRQVAGQIAKYNGRLFEGEIQASFDKYRQSRTAIISRAHPPVAGPPGHMWYAGRGDVDFVGQWHGRPIAFDAKSVDHSARSWKFSERDIHQGRFLRDWQVQGGLGFVLLRQEQIAFLLFDVEALAIGEAVVLREKQKPPKGGALAESPKKLLPYITRTEDGFWPILEGIEAYEAAR